MDSSYHPIGDTISLEYGQHVIMYEGQDDCGDTLITGIDTIMVLDTFPPVLQCITSTILVAINSGAHVIVPVDSLFKGTIDGNCGPVTLYGRKQDTTCSTMDTVLSKNLRFCSCGRRNVSVGFKTRYEQDLHHIFRSPSSLGAGIPYG